MFVLGVSWLVLTPLCLWNLFRGGRLVRLTSVLALVALEAATIWATAAATVRVPPPTPVLAAPPAAAPGQVSSSTGLSFPTGPSGPSSEAAPRQGARSASCAARIPVPERVRPARGGGASWRVTPFWAAGRDGCATVTVVLRHRNRAVR